MDLFSTYDTGSVFNRFSQDLQIIDTELPVALIGTCISILTVVAQCVVIVSQLPWAGLAVVAISVILVLILKVYLRTSRRLRYLDIEMKSPILGVLIEAAESLATIRAFGWTQWQCSRGLEVLGKAQVPFYLLKTAQVALNLFLDSIVAILAITVVSIAVGLRNSSGGGLGLALLNIVSLGSTIRMVVFFYSTLEITIGAVARIRDFVLQVDSENRGRLQPPPDWPTRGIVKFSDVTLSPSTSAPPIIKGLKLDISAGSKVAICGRSGSGKTTLVNTLLQLVHLSSGSIMIDGVDLASLQPRSVRSRVVAMPQETFQVDISIRNYADLCNVTCDEATIIQAFKKIGLWSAIESAGGLEMLLTDDRLSHGQQQLVTMTLACLRRGQLVLMDEPTSHVDGEIQSRFYSTVLDAFEDSTVICITHQLGTILDFDTVVVLEDGVVVEQGPPRELISQGGSKLREIYPAAESA